MLPSKTRRGLSFLDHIKVFDRIPQIPPPYDKKKQSVIPAILKVVCCKPTWKFASLGGWLMGWAGSTRRSRPLWRRGRRGARFTTGGKSSSWGYEIGLKEHRREKMYDKYRGPQHTWTSVLNPIKLLIPLEKYPWFSTIYWKEFTLTWVFRDFHTTWLLTFFADPSVAQQK